MNRDMTSPHGFIMVNLAIIDVDLHLFEERVTLTDAVEIYPDHETIATFARSIDGGLPVSVQNRVLEEEGPETLGQFVLVSEKVLPDGSVERVFQRGM